MGKIVKYCSSCDEGFAEKFGFCPDCGAQLQAFEMSPVPPKEAIDTVPSGFIAAAGHFCEARTLVSKPEAAHDVGLPLLTIALDGFIYGPGRLPRATPRRISQH